MKMVRQIVIDLVLINLCLSCSNGSSSEVSQEEVSCISYEDSTYCFNGRWKIFSNGLEGLSDGQGNVLVEPLFNEIYFINDDIALLERSGLFYLANRDGRVFAEGTDKADLEASASKRYEQMLSEDLFFWDEILDDLESLGRECLSGGHKSREMYESLKERLSNAQGYMTESQICRFESIVENFHNSR